MSVDVGTARGYLDLDISGFLRSLRTAQTEAASTSRSITSRIGDDVQTMGKSLTTVGSTLTKFVTVPLLGVGAAGIKVATDFEKGMSEVKAISGATGKEFDALREKAIELGADTAFSAGEVAEAMTEMAKAGWSSQQIIEGMGGVLDAAAASGEDLAVVSTIVADTITGFGLAASESSKIADILTQAANSGTIGIIDLGESFKYIAPVAGAMGLSVEDVTTAISAMSMAGIKGSQAGTALRTMLTRMIKPNEDTAKAMAILGVEVKNADGSMKSLDEIVGSLRKGFDGLTESEKAKYAATIAGQEGMAGMLALLNLTEEEYNAIALSMENADGVAQQTATTMQDNLQSKIEQLLGSLESLAIKLSDVIIPYFRQFVEWLTSLIDKFIALDPETQKTILKFGAIAIAAGPVITVVGTLTTGIGKLITTVGEIPATMTRMTTSLNSMTSALTGTTASSTTFGSALSGLAAAAGPILAVVAVIAVLVAAFVNLWKNNEEFRNKVIAIWNEIKETFNNFAQGIVDRLNALGFDFENITEVLKALWEGFCNFLAPIFEGVFQYIADTFGFILNQILAVLDFFIALFSGDWEGAWNAIKDFFINIWNYIKDFFTNIWNTIIGILDVMCSWFGTTWENVWTSIKDFFVNIWNSIVSFFTGIWNGIVNGAIACWNGISSAWRIATGWFSGNIINPIKSFFTGMWDGLKNGAKNAWEGIKSVFSVVTTWFKNTFSKAWEGVVSVFSPLGNVFKSIKEGIVSVFKSVVNGLIDGINWIIKKPFQGLNNILDTLYKLEILGVQPFSWLTWRAPVPQIPHLAKGAVLNPNNPFLAVVGDQKQGVNVEAPLATIQEAVARVIKSFAYDIIELQQVAVNVLSSCYDELGYISYHGFKKPTDSRNQNKSHTKDNAGGDTFNFYSPKPIDEIEAAKQIKRTKRDLAEGF